MTGKQRTNILQDTITFLRDQLLAAGRREEELLRQVESLTSRVSELQATLQSLTSSFQESKADANRLKNQKRALGKLLENKSEKINRKQEEKEEAKNIPEEPKFDPKSRGNNGVKRKEYFNVETRLHEIYPCDPDFDPLKARIISHTDSIRYSYHPGWFEKHIYRQYNCVQGDNIYNGKSPKAPLQNSSYDGSFLSGILQLRYIYSLPVERIVKLFNEQGIALCKQTAHGLIAKSAGLLERMYEVLKKSILEDSYLSMDETYYKVLVNEKNESGKKVRKGYLWGMYANHTELIAFIYENGSRSKSIAEKLLTDYKGALQTDGYAAYADFRKEEYPDIIPLACFQHCKRKFLDMKEDRQAQEVVDIINELYQNEHLIPPDWEPKQILAWRKKYAPPILGRLKAKLESIQSNPQTLPKSLMGEAVRYTLNLYDVLCNYIKSADYQLDNNRIERINRYISLSRRNSLFAGSHAGAQRMALFYSLACSARLHNLNTFDYFTDLFNRLADIQPTAQDSVFRNLLPDKWIPCH